MLLYCNPRRGDRPPALGVEASLSGDVLLVGFLVGVSLVGGDSGPENKGMNGSKHDNEVVCNS